LVQSQTQYAQPRMTVRQPAMALAVFKQVSPYVDREIHTQLE
jgi:hypothetical protein